MAYPDTFSEQIAGEIDTRKNTGYQLETLVYF